MIVKLKVHTLYALALLLALGMQGCAPAPVEPTEFALFTSTPGDIPTWTPRPVEMTQTALPTATRPAPASSSTPRPRAATETPEILPTAQAISVRIVDGNLFVRRGPSVNYNYVGVLYEDEVVVATGRDRVSRWIRVAFPAKPNKEPDREGWITTESDYTLIDGDISNLPYIETEPARPAFIRNCTKHQMWILPADVYLSAKSKEPFNEAQFPVGLYQVYDVENEETVPIEEIDLSEGERVDIRYDWTGERSKCEE
jgi:hypothetical protein